MEDKCISKNKLKGYQSMSLSKKIRLSEEIIKDFYHNIPNNENVYISSSFGKDSIVLIDLVRKEYPNLPIIYCNTGVELKGSEELSKKYDNVITLKPIKPMEKVIEENGYMLPLGKAKTNILRLARNNLANSKFDTYAVKKISGTPPFDKKSLWNYSKYAYCLAAPFKISEECCKFLKIKPLKKFCKEHNFKYSYVGTTAEESRLRTDSIQRFGFNKEFQSRPLGHWTEQDILKYIKTHSLELADCYGEIKEQDGKLYTSKFNRNGCFCCPVGCHLKNPNQFQLLEKYYPNDWEYAVKVLGYGKVFDFLKIPYSISTEKQQTLTKIMR